MVKLVMGLHRRNPKMVKLEVELHQGCYIREHEVSRVVELVMGLQHQRCKRVKFLMELRHGSAKKYEASIGASPYGLPHPCEPVSGRLHKWGW